MSKLEELIQELCPNGVEHSSLLEIFNDIKGMSGVSNKWASDGNCRFIDYMNVYKNMSIDVKDLPFATVKKLNQDVLEKGDILFTSASEVADECAIAAAIENDIMAGIFLDDHLFGLRLKKEYKNRFITGFLKHYFRSTTYRKNVLKAVRGVTRFYISKPDFKKIIIPIPPIEVQSEIVRILDNFTLLTAELTAELTARKEQYEYYRESLLTFDMSINKTTIGDVCHVCAGGTPSRTVKSFWENGTIPWLGSTVCKNKKTVDVITEYITEEGLNKSSAKMLKEKTTLIALVGATIGKIAFLPFPATINQNIAGLYPIDIAKLNPDFLYYWCSTLYNKFENLGNGKLSMANLSFVRNLPICVPPIEVQQRIVNVLENFESLCNDLGIGLPAEIEARKQQYEFYRTKLLTMLSEGVDLSKQASKQASKIDRDIFVLVQYVFGFVRINIEQFVSKISNIKWKYDKGEYYYIDLSSVDTETHEIKNIQLINRDNAPSRAQQIVEIDDILFGTTRPMLKRITMVNEDYDNQICSTGFCVLRSNQKLIRPKWLYYMMSTKDFYSYVKNTQKGASYPAITDKEVKDYIICVPTLKDQDKIISVLDNFEEYTTSLSIGLPAEIELRKQQYEYYRNKLLTFKEL